MSFRIPLDELKKHQETTKLKKLLTLMSSPKKKFSRAGGKFQTYEKKTVVNMYMVENGILYIPYTFAKVYFSDNKFFSSYLKVDEKPQLFPEGKKGKFKGNLREYQVDVYTEAKEILKIHKTITLALYPSFGKTFLGSIFSWFLNSYTVILVHREVIAQAWEKTYKSFLLLEEGSVIMVDDKMNKPDKKSGICPVEKGKIFICMYSRWKKIPVYVREKIKLLIVDEAHTFCTPDKVESLLFLNPKYVIAMTATRERVDDGLEIVIETICGKQSIERFSEKKFKFYIVDTDLDFKIEGHANKFGELVEKQSKSLERNSMILSLVKKHTHFKTMIIGKRKEHCNFLKDCLEREKIECETLFGTKKKCRTKNILIGTDSKMGTGFDESNACIDYDDVPSELLFMLHSYAKWSTFEQVIGRGKRSKNPKVVMFLDKNRTTKNHFREIRKWVKESNGEIIDVKKEDIEKISIF